MVVSVTQYTMQVRSSSSSSSSFMLQSRAELVRRDWLYCLVQNTRKTFIYFNTFAHLQ